MTNKNVTDLKHGAELISEERLRQISKEGYTARNDDEHFDGSLAIAAACYAYPGRIYEKREFATGNMYNDPFPDGWQDKRRHKGNVPAPLDANPSTRAGLSERRDLLVKAGALIAAEIDRLNRLEDYSEKKLFPVNIDDIRKQ